MYPLTTPNAFSTLSRLDLIAAHYPYISKSEYSWQSGAWICSSLRWSTYAQQHGQRMISWVLSLMFSCLFVRGPEPATPQPATADDQTIRDTSSCSPPESAASPVPSWHQQLHDDDRLTSTLIRRKTYEWVRKQDRYALTSHPIQTSGIPSLSSVVLVMEPPQTTLFAVRLDFTQIGVE